MMDYEREIEKLSEDLSDYVKVCTSQFRWGVGTIVLILLGTLAFFYNTSQTLTEVKTTLVDMSRAQNQEHEERMRYDQTINASSGDTRKLIDSLQSQINDLKVQLGLRSVK